MLRFGLVCLAGFIGGSLCGVVIFAFGFLGAAQISPIDIANTLQVGVVFGGGFGIVAFPICYYIFLQDIPLWVSLAATIPATIVVGLLGLYFLLKASSPGDSQAEFYIFIFGPGFLGLLLSSIALNKFGAKFGQRG